MMLSKDKKSRNVRIPPGQRPIKHLLRWGVDHPAIGEVPEIDLKGWTLIVEGEVDKPLTLTWDALLTLPRVESVSDFHCVEGWSVLGLKWEGVKFQYLAQLVKPKETARFASFECADGYATSLSLDELLKENILLAYKVNGEYLEKGTGAPLRLVVPDKYGYKSALWLTRIIFTSKKELGYWEKRGYSDTADVWKDDRFSKRVL